MSGIAAVAAAPGEQIDETHYRRWAALLASGGQALKTRSVPEVGLAIALTNPYSDWAFADAPLTVEGEVWVVADARIDAQNDLIGALRAAGRRFGARPSDAELILHAYGAWGTHCVDHLFGDFAFVIWDGRARRLFAARDRFGVRQLYFSRTRDALLVSSDPNALFRHPGVDRSIDVQTVAGFLVSNDMGADDATAFAAIRRLPAAHSLTWERGTLTIERYWTVPVEEPLRLGARSDYPAMFWNLVSEAAEDVGRGHAVGVLLSGGLDSPMLAAALQHGASGGRVTGHTAVWRDLMPDIERPFAERVAHALGIPLATHPYDAFPAFDRSEQVQLAQPVPDGSPFSIDTHDLFDGIARGSRVAVTGLGPDALLRGEPLLPRLLHGPGRIRTAAGALAYAARERKRPPLGIRPWISNRKSAPRIPAWLPQPIADIATALSKERVPGEHRFRASAYRVTASGFWAKYLEWYAGTARHSGVRCAHPFFDVRIVTFALRLPAIPWTWDKHIAREATHSHLPEEVVLRRKTPLIRDRMIAYTERHGLDWIGTRRPSGFMGPFFDGSGFAALADEYRRQPGWVHVRPICLDLFLRAWNEQQVVR